MQENQFKSIIKNNIMLHQSGKIDINKAINNICECVFERPKLICQFGDEYCSVNNGNIKPCESCRVSYEYEITTTN